MVSCNGGSHIIDRGGPRGWVVIGDGGAPVMVGEDDVATAGSRLVQALVHSNPGEHVAVHFVTAEQNPRRAKAGSSTDNTGLRTFQRLADFPPCAH